MTERSEVAASKEQRPTGLQQNKMAMAEFEWLRANTSMTSPFGMLARFPLMSLLWRARFKNPNLTVKLGGAIRKNLLDKYMRKVKKPKITSNG
jgi:hypothetical protein